MLISRKHRKVLINSRDPGRIQAVIPHAKTAPFRGNTMVAVPHGIDETKILRNLGYDIQSPSQVYYDFPGRHKPFHAQMETVGFLPMHERAYVLSGMGTGKTMGALWSADHLIAEGLVHKVLIVAPLSTLERTWADSVFFNFPQRSWAVLHGTRKRRFELLASDADFYVINTDGVVIIEEVLAKRPDIDLVIVDEGALFRTAGTARWKALNAIVNKQHKRRCWWMTGTPTPNQPTDAWAQCRIVTPVTTPKYFGAFRDSVMKQVTQYKWVAKPDAVEKVHALMHPAIRFRLEDCVDLPPTLIETREVKFSPEQDKAYREMMTTLHTEMAAGEITAINAAVKAGKLFQIGMGVAYDSDGGTIHLPCESRLNEVLEIVEQAEGKVIVFVPFTGALERVAGHVGQKYAVEVVQGETKKADRDRIFGAFQARSDPHVLVMNPTVAAHGLTLTAATVIVWYGPITSNEIYEQACARVRRPGQKRTTLIVHLCGSPAEQKQYDRLADKGLTQGILLDMFKEAA